jgi:hypothetical protein
MVGDGVEGDREQRRERALASLREGWRLAEAAGYSNVSNDEINAEIDRIRRMPDGESECI